MPLLADRVRTSEERVALEWLAARPADAPTHRWIAVEMDGVAAGVDGLRTPLTRL
jgi:hypothetical protein